MLLTFASGPKISAMNVILIINTHRVFIDTNIKFDSICMHKAQAIESFQMLLGPLTSV